jgi:hypothetical protein
MRKPICFAIVGVLVPWMLGVGHCEGGDTLAFERQGIPVPILVVSRGVTSPTRELNLALMVYSNGFAQASREEEGNLQTASVHVGPEEAASLHAALGAAGASALSGPVADGGAVQGVNRSTRITYLEPSLAAGHAWSNTFSFGNAPLDPRAIDSWSIVEDFVALNLGRVFEE